jgi:SAM-dependent MidA family methyltransferase
MVADRSRGHPALVGRIRDEIGRGGPIPFDRFMELALYDPDDGYYTHCAGRPAVSSAGPSADFQTSPHVHPVFGHIVAGELVQIWRTLGQPRPFVVVEPGAGDGTLANQIHGGLRERVPDVPIEYHAADARVMRDDSLTLTLSQRETEMDGRLSHGEREQDGGLSHTERDRVVAWPSLEAVSQAGIRAHCVVSNEFFDALPVHRLAVIGGKLREIYVDGSRGGFVERVGELSNCDLADLAIRDRDLPPEGWRGEVCLRLEAVLAQLAGLIDAGVILAIDYGYGLDFGADDRFPRDTLVAYHRHQWNSDLLRRVGEQDLTAHVDFGTLLRLGQRQGLAPAGWLSQRDFLLRRGIAAEAERWAAREPTPGRQWQTRFAISELTKSDGIGRLQVVALQKGAPTYSLL